MPPAKAIKTERTHEENQERAYIAASRRSDRSLEARVESARRASEIHKRRTGRSLRVTEQDVINEEMYEEEDDDLPSQYRRLTAHLHTGSVDFNKRLSAYLTSNVAMRSAVEQAVNNSYDQQYGGGQQFGQSSMFPSPMLTHQAQQLRQQQQQASTSHRQSPYPSARPQQDSGSSHQRSASMFIPQEISGNFSHNTTGQLNSDRRLSLPAVKAKSDSPSEPPTPTSASSSKSKPSFPPGSFSSQQIPHQKPISSSTYNNNNNNNNNVGSFTGGQNYGPFSSTLPAEQQIMLGSTMNDPYMHMLMNGSDNQSDINWNFDAQLQSTSDTVKPPQTFPSFDGLHSTLAPSAFNQSDANQSFFDDALKIGNGNETLTGTPGINGESWGSFIDTDQWDIPAASQQSQTST
ncbi:hypothetical protein LSUB1_G000293 [Lachnellula subtilissima]|uniref:Uncharacterized protein n=1 Tax=Lachnellula subtilissima TaxID=602034 RepID=A0A8H8S2C3_9HELO|nr:hypothetical protein LSUB1_G000293 [Lachnellula subtilissima]